MRPNLTMLWEVGSLKNSARMHCKAAGNMYIYADDININIFRDQ